MECHLHTSRRRKKKVQAVIALCRDVVNGSSSSPSSYSHFYVGSMYDGIRLHVARPYTSSADSPFSLISSLTMSTHLLLGLHLFLLPCTFITIALLQYVVFLSSHHMPIPLQPSLQYFLCDFAHFRCHFRSLRFNKIAIQGTPRMAVD